MATFFTSDTHFGHVNICRLANRPFADVEEMNRAIINNWNSVVSPTDTVFVLGDFALGKIVDTLQHGLMLNGDKILISGNHDRTFTGFGRSGDLEPEEWKQQYVELAGFSYHIASDWHLSEKAVPGGIIRLSHFPYDGDSHDRDRFSEARLPDVGRPLIHGHTHGKEHLTVSKNGTPQFHVGQDAWDFTPVSYQTVLDSFNEFYNG